MRKPSLRSGGALTCLFLERSKTGKIWADIHIFMFFFSMCNMALLLCQHNKAWLACEPIELMLKAVATIGIPSVSPEIQKKTKGIDMVAPALQEAHNQISNCVHWVCFMHCCYALCKGIISPSVPSGVHVYICTTSWHCLSIVLFYHFCLS